MRKKRPEIPSHIASQVLFSSDRTCCVCRVRGKPVLIHHLNNDPSDNSLNNLAVLCFDCHRETQIRGGFDRKLDAEQITLYRDSWKRVVVKQRAEIELYENADKAIENAKLKIATSIAEIYKENKDYVGLVIHYDVIGNKELRDKYIEIALKNKLDDSTICFLRDLQGKPELIPNEVVRRELSRLTKHKDFSQRARFHKMIGLNLEAIKDYLLSVQKNLYKDNYFTAAYYIKEMIKEGLPDELFILALIKAQKEKSLWWQIRAFQELGWKKELKKLVEDHATEIENSDDHFLKLELAKIRGDLKKFIEIRKEIARLEQSGSKRRPGTMPTYRKRKDSDTWHWCRNCSNWPTSNYEERTTKPSSGELCNHCRAKQKAGDCRG